MGRTVKLTGLILLTLGLILGIVMVFPKIAKAEGVDNNSDYELVESSSSQKLAAPNYTANATATNNPGVYETQAQAGADKSTTTIGIPTVSKQNLENNPTEESPAIITGAAVNYEDKTGPTEFTPKEGATLVAPYSEFRWSVIDEQVKDADGNVTTHKKLSGFDGTYYIIRVDLKPYLEAAGANLTDASTQFIHIKQEGNTALMVLSGMGTGYDAYTFSDALGNWTGSYSLKNNAAELRAKTNSPDDKIYFDIILQASGKLAAGADQGQQGVPSSDWGLSFYIDNTLDYNPGLHYDPQSTDPNHAANCLAKFFKQENYNATDAQKKTSYTVKGSDLEIDVMVDDREVTGDKPQFWSLTNAISHQPFDSHTIKLISEVPVLEGLNLTGTATNHRNVILDVNSFDIQIANNTTTNQAGLVVGNNATLTIMDSTRTAGAELAIGNNANMIIQNGGTLIVDPTCVFEVEYDAASVTQGQSASPLSNGEIIIENGGTLINNGVVNVEGTEGKPIDVTTPVSRDIRPAVMIIQPGGVFNNNGTLSVKGRLYVLGNLTNNGQYNDIISKTDPDKGSIDYHKGLQITWKDDVTQAGVVPGTVYVGIDPDGNIYRSATLVNNGDVVIAPGAIELYGILDTRNGHIYLCDVTEAIIPVAPTTADPLTVEKRIQLSQIAYGLLNVHEGATILGSEANFSGGKVALLHNGVMGALTNTGEAIKNIGDVRADDFVLSANDGVRDLIQGVDFILHDGWVEFTDAYLSSFSGVRTARINIGYRFLYIDVVGTKPTDTVKRGAAPKTGDNNSMMVWLIIMLSGMSVLGTTVCVSRRKANK
ncbi:MAG: hypothetical protein E7279_06945 [Lachnospiraceae bacterium]|nr:hypothetical protein [Lachnospiraceae bacterium]